MRRTYGEIKSQLARVAGQSGLSVGDTRLLEMVNEAQERLCTLGEWDEMYDRIRFCQYEGLVALPVEYSNITAVVIEGRPHELTDPWFEFVSAGPGPVTSQYEVAIPRGEAPVYRQSRDVPRYIRVYSSADERTDGVRPTVRICGLDENGHWVRTEVNGVWQDGENVELRGDDVTNYATTTHKFSKVTFVEKARTNGHVVLHYIDDLDVETQAARYNHYDVNPTFQIYHIPTIGDDSTKCLQARVRRRVSPITQDSDLMTISNITALKHAIKAVGFSDQGKDVESETSYEVAKRVLGEAAKLNRGGRPNAPITVKMVGGFEPDYIH